MHERVGRSDIGRIGALPAHLQNEYVSSIAAAKKPLTTAKDIIQSVVDSPDPKDLFVQDCSKWGFDLHNYSDPNVEAALGYLDTGGCPAVSVPGAQFKLEATGPVPQLELRGTPAREFANAL